MFLRPTFGELLKDTYSFSNLYRRIHRIAIQYQPATMKSSLAAISFIFASATTTTVNAFVNPPIQRLFSNNININIMTATTILNQTPKTVALAAAAVSDTKVSADDYKEALLAARDDIDILLAENACGKCVFWKF